MLDQAPEHVTGSGPQAPARPRTEEAKAVLVLALAAVLVAGVVAVSEAEAYWLSVPVAVAGAALCRRRGAAVVVGSLAVGLAAAPALVEPRLGALPPLSLALGVPLLSAAVTRFVRERLEAGHQALAVLARCDPLTGLANRRGLDDRLGYEVLRHSRHGRRLALIMLDLNAFKAINERFGHSGGDELLRDVATALKAAVRQQDTVARLGGDEFCVLAPETGREEAGRLVERLRPAVQRATGGFEELSGSVGCAIFPEDGTTAAEVMAAADAAQAEEKRRARVRDGRSAVRVGA